MANDKAVATVDENRYLSILKDPDMAIAIRDNVGPNITPFMLPRVRIPNGTPGSWTLIDLNGEPYPSKTIEGIIVHSATWRGYWPEEFGQGDVFPQCSSKDGVIGTGNPGGECGQCPLNEFGTSSRQNNRGKACKEMRATFLLQPGDIFPTLILMPPSSLKDMSGYMMNLANKRLSYWKVETSLSLTSDKNADGIAYSKALPKYVRTLSPDEVGAVAEYRMQLRPIIEGQVIRQDDVELAD